jgi:transcriptional regulator with XRE-family HTH domain
MERRPSVAASPTPAEAQLALRLRQLREETHLTQAQVAALFSTEFKVGAASISSWENIRTAASPPQSRLEQYARLVATSRRPNSQAQLPARAELSEAEEEHCQRLLADLDRLWEAARGSQEQEATAAATYRSWFFDDEGPVAIICPAAPPEARGPLVDAQNPNYTNLQAYADLDALIELFGHIRAENEPLFPVTFKLASKVAADDLSGHLVLLGGVAWNDLTRHLLRSLIRLPVRQFESPDLTTGEIFAVGRDASEQRFEPEWAPDDPKELVEDVGLLARVRNPYNSGRTLTLCNGIHSRGVLGAVRALTDVRVRDTNESYLAERFGDDEYAILMRVPVFQGEALSPDLRNPETRLYEWSSPVERDRA